MIASSDVLLLRPAGPWDGIHALAAASRGGRRLIVATLCFLDVPPGPGFSAFFQARAVPLLADAGAVILGCLETEPSENTYPRLPVRDADNAFVWFSSFPGPQAHHHCLGPLARSPDWAEQVLPQLERYLLGPPHQLRLAPATGPNAAVQA